MTSGSFYIDPTLRLRSTVKSLKKFLKFASLIKVEEGEGGLARAYFISTSPAVDSENESCDYAATKPEYQSWSDACFKSTVAAGQEPSLGNIRLMHTAEVAGKADKLEFDDAGEKVYLGAVAVDQRISDMLRRGFLTGASQGGKYLWRRCSVDQTDISTGDNYCPTCKKNVVVRYAASISEVSLVDNPANPEARFQYVKGPTIELRKFSAPDKADADLQKFILNLPAVTEAQLDALLKGDDPKLSDDQRNALAVLKGEKKTKRVAGEDLGPECFAYVGDKDKTVTWHYPISGFSSDAKTKRHIRNALSQWNKPKGQVNIPESEREAVHAKLIAAARKHGIDVEGESEKFISTLHAGFLAKAKNKGVEVAKGLYDVSRFAELLQGIAYLWQSSVYEADYEGDESDVPGMLEENVDALAEALLAMVAEETAELTARKSAGAPAKDNKTMNEDLLKAARKALAGFCKGMCKVHKAMADQHMQATETEQELGEAHKVKMEHHKAAMDGAASPEEKAAQKVHHDFHKSCHKCHMDKAVGHEKMHKYHSSAHDHFEKLSTANMDDLDGAKAAADHLEKSGVPDAPVVVDVAAEIKKAVNAALASGKEEIGALTKRVEELTKVGGAADPLEKSPLGMGLALRKGQQGDTDAPEIPTFIKVLG